MRTFVIGDVHGMLDELRTLVGTLNPVVGDRFVFLGDLVDKGPNSLGVLRHVKLLLSLYPGSVAICGNHEESAMRLYEKGQKNGWDGLRKVEKEPWIKAMTPEDYEFLRSLPLVARPLDGVVCVHGGMFPDYFAKHDVIGDVPTAWHKGGGKKMDRMRRFLRIRHVHRETGQMVSLGDEGGDTQPWGDWYDGREGFAFYGHAPQKEGRVVVHNYAMGLDTGAVFGGKLTAAVVTPGTPPLIPGMTNMHVTTKIAGPIHVELVQVQAARSYAEWLEAFEAD
jgi:hypothetical protein